MISFLAGKALEKYYDPKNNCLTDSERTAADHSLEQKYNVVTACALFEMSIYIAAIVIAHLIAANALPKALEILKGRMALATAMMATAIPMLALPSFILAIGMLSKKMEVTYT